MISRRRTDAEIVDREIRESPAVTYSPAHGGMWILLRYRDVKAALKDHETFSSGSGVYFSGASGVTNTPRLTSVRYGAPLGRVALKAFTSDRWWFSSK